MNMQACIDACTRCSQVCLRTAMNHCLEAGGKHVEPEHFRLMMSCVQICQTSAYLQLASSTFSKKYCALCAEICTACAQSCAALDNMQECVDVCNACADSCRSMAA